MFYKSTFYKSIFYKSSPCFTICQLERVNERGLRAVFCNWNLSYKNLLKRANLTTFYNKRLQYKL